METKFENRYVRTREVMKEFYLFFFFKRPFRVALHTICLVLICLFGGVVIDLTSRDVPLEDLSTYFLGIFIWAAIPLIQLLSCFLTLRTVTQRDLELNGGKPPVAVVMLRDEDILLSSETGGETHIAYQNIKKVHQTKNLILLKTRAGLVVILSKSGFTQGTTQDCLTFVRQRIAHP